MKKYFSFFRIRFQAGLQYRAAALAGIVTQFFWGIMSILMYRAFYESGSGEFPMDFSGLCCYIWLQQSFLALFMTWFYDNDIFDSITKGGVAYELCRPADLYWMWFVKNAAIRVSRMALRCLPILLVAALLPKPYGMRLPCSLSSGVMFLISMTIGFLVMVAFTMLVYISAFYTISPMGVRILVTSVMEFFCGAVVPIPFFPDWLQKILYALPFASMQNVPFLIYTGHIPPQKAVGGLLLQGMWLLLLLTIGKCWMKKALTKVVVQGG